jgi:N-methylhydantoinase A
VVERYHVSYPTLDIISIGAGGGSIAWIDPAVKVIHVGPKSAGAYPGPACYGFGGTEPTVTDANLILGYLNPDYFLDGAMKLYPDKAYEAIKKLADQVGMDVKATAAAIYDIVNANMSDLIRGITMQRGYDPREMVLFAFGGAGPAHAAMYAAELGVKEVLVPSAASTYSALGLATSDLLHTRVLFDYNQVPMDVNRFNKNFETLEKMIAGDLDRDQIKEEDRTVLYFLEMKYGFQYHLVRVPIPRKKYKAEDMDFVASQFDTAYEGIYGKGAGYTPAGRFINTFIVQGIGRIPKVHLSRYEGKSLDASGALKGKRNAFFRKYDKYVTTNIYYYGKLQAGNIIEGPAIIEAAWTTMVIPPDQKGRVDEYLNIVIK